LGLPKLQAAYAEFVGDLEKLSEEKQYVMTVWEIAMVMLSIRVELLKRELMESEEFKDQIFRKYRPFLVRCNLEIKR
jgi:hypothetical protein